MNQFNSYLMQEILGNNFPENYEWDIGYCKVQNPIFKENIRRIG